MLNKDELIVYNPETKQDAVAKLIDYDIDSGTIWSKISDGSVVVSTSKDVLKRNTPENIKKVCSIQ